MLNFEMYNPSDCNCVIRSLTKMLDNVVEVFEKYMEIHNIFKEESELNDLKIKDN